MTSKKPDMPDTKYLIAKKDAAKRIGVTPVTLDRAVNAGKLHRYKADNGYNTLFDIREIDALPVMRPATGPVRKGRN
ncbi:hypothetical protein [Geodermatophilus sp. DSM 45219]|uniref:hypothetical protein n=1 Tax=Geodermatophilus sp. DSM 45219 TaxID=1881103 RepID=UPI000880D624|nr:hypothetical protein [Geodermatophilus sp. DSM 45219]SDN78582.1 hypothetical protein SAMN05428965_1618 [Geodermatophilus sp. DSM 45219]